MRTAIILLLLSNVVAGANLKRETPVIRIAAERNGISYKSDDWYLLCAIRMAENGREGLEFGIMDKRADNLDKQAGWASATIINQHKRSGIKAVNAKFIDSLGNRYCPVGCDNDNGTNKFWKKNVTYWFKELRK